MTNPKSLGLAFLVAFLVVVTVHFLDFRGSVPNFRKRSDGGTLLDIRPSFSEAEVYGSHRKRLTSCMDIIHIVCAIHLDRNDPLTGFWP